MKSNNLCVYRCRLWFCRKFHSEIDEVNALGIEVRYLPWPRSEQTMPIMEKNLV